MTSTVVQNNTAMSTVVVFACKSNSCRSQMAEGWAKKWVEDQRLLIKARQATRRREQQLAAPVSSSSADAEEYDDRLLSFLDGLLLLSVALDESAITSKAETPINDSISSTATNTSICVTCHGEACPNSQQRKVVKSKAIQAMAQDGVDISSYFPKSIGEITPLILDSVQKKRDDRAQSVMKKRRVVEQLSMKRVLGFLQKASKDMGLAYAGIQRDTKLNLTDTEISEEQIMVDNLIVLCSCPNLKRRLSDMSKQTTDWDIDAPTDAAKSGEGDAAYVRVSRQIKCKVDELLDGFMREALDRGGSIVQ